MSASTEFTDVDLLRATVGDLQSLLTEGKLTSVQLVIHILHLINSDQDISLKINATISVASLDKVLNRARWLDEERRSGRVLSELHGIPILIKDAIITDDKMGMPTTVGSFALAEARVHKNAEVVQRLIDKGMIVIAKTNMNEFCNMKGNKTCNGWSAYGGQTMFAYVATGLDYDDGVMGHSNPCGSSTGSAVGVSAGYAPIALGTETEGSLISPAGRAALFALKCTPGITTCDGVWLISRYTDSIGFFAKSVKDLALASELALTTDAQKRLPEGGFCSYLTGSVADLSIGYLDAAKWSLSARMQVAVESITHEQRLAYDKAIATFRRHGARVFGPVNIPHPSDESEDSRSMFSVLDTIFLSEYAENIKEYLRHYETSPVRTVEDIVRYNEAHSEQELPPRKVFLLNVGGLLADTLLKVYPNQHWLTEAWKNSPTKEELQRAVDYGHRIAGTEGVEHVMDDNKLDVIVVLLDSPLHSVAAATGYPIATVPLGISNFNGRPFGLAILAKAGREDRLIAFMHAFETVFPARKLPEALIEARKASNTKL